MPNQNEELKKAGLKATLPRIKIMEVLASTALQEEAHFSAEDIYRELILKNEDIGLATVYRVLTQFEAAACLLYTSPSPRDLSTSRMPSSA